MKRFDRAPLGLVVIGWVSLVLFSIAECEFDKNNPIVGVHYVAAERLSETEGVIHVTFDKNRQCHMNVSHTSIALQDKHDVLHETAAVFHASGIASSDSNTYGQTILDARFSIPNRDGYSITVNVEYDCDGRIVSQSFPKVISVL